MLVPLMVEHEAAGGCTPNPAFNLLARRIRLRGRSAAAVAQVNWAVRDQ